MSSTNYRDLWASGKVITPEVVEQIAKVKASLIQGLANDARALDVAAREMQGAETFREFYAAIDKLAEVSRRVSHSSHAAKFFCDWNVMPQPEFNDQFVNQFFLFSEFKRTFWLEGAVMCGLGIEPGGRILELCCGSGYYTDLFYSPFAAEIVAVDFDPRAIEMAQRFAQRPNVRYEVMDIRERLPEGPFDTVIWDAAIEHFTVAEIDHILERARKIMIEDGRLLGYTIAESAETPQHPDHETHFEGMTSLGNILKRSFKNVRVFERIHPTMNPSRHNLFYYASDGVLPFDEPWTHGLRL